MELASLFLWLASPHWPEGCWGPERGRTRSAGACELASTCLAGRCTLPAAPSAQRAISNPRRCLWPFSGLTPPITHIQRPAAGVPLVPVALLDKAPLATFLSSVQAGPHLSMGTSGDSGPCCLSNVLIIPPAASQRSQPSRLVALRYFLVVSQCGRAHTQVLMRN